MPDISNTGIELIRKVKCQYLALFSHFWLTDFHDEISLMFLPFKIGFKKCSIGAERQNYLENSNFIFPGYC